MRGLKRPRLRRAAARPERAPRTRRSAEEARTALLDAAERRLIQHGPAGIRLQDVARDVGVSHPTVLHHFGSREALVHAVVDRAFASLDADLVTAIAGVPAGEEGVVALLDRCAKTLSERGHARALAWLALAGWKIPTGIGQLGAVVGALQARRTTEHARRGEPPPALEDTTFTVFLTSFSLIGEAIVGPLFTAGLPPDELERLRARFRAWLGRLLVAHLVGDARDQNRG
jgi:AcrR family transcriptional regulator